MGMRGKKMWGRGEVLSRNVERAQEMVVQMGDTERGLGKTLRSKLRERPGLLWLGLQKEERWTQTMRTAVVDPGADSRAGFVGSTSAMRSQ